MQRYRGYSILELICFLVCLMIFLGLSSLTWIHYSSDLRRYMFVQRIKSGLMYARNYAIRQKKSVIYCGSKDGLHCDGEWAKGQLVLVKGTEKVLRFFASSKANLRVQFSANFGHNQAIEFLSTGATNGQQGHFSFCSMPEEGLLRHCTWVSINLAGEVEIREQRINE